MRPLDLSANTASPDQFVSPAQIAQHLDQTPPHASSHLRSVPELFLSSAHVNMFVRALVSESALDLSLAAN